MTVTVGIDGGQSEIRMRVSGESRDEAAPGVSHLESDTATSVVEAIRRLRGNRSTPIDRLVAGLTTIPATEEERHDLAVRLAEATGAADVWVCGDQVTSHAGAFEGETGVVLSVGTGVACLALDGATGANRTFDGAGYLVGDEGGGFWLGRLGIRAALAAYEGRAPHTTLTSSVADELGPLDAAAARLHANPRAVDSIAQMATIVLAEAEEGDAIANTIVSDSATLLVTTVSAALFFLPSGEDTRVAIDGRLLLNENQLQTAFLAEMKSTHPSVDVFQAHRSSLDGACMLAQHETPGAYSDLITTYRMEL
ncbi:MAG: ATPase [Actinomycetia bacterium]|nr:ATPase [Actinomycetes bacterium]